MNLNIGILKYLCLGIVIGGIGTAIYFGASQSNSSFDLDLIEEDHKYQFLYKLAKKVFPYLKSKNPTAKSDTKAVTRDDLISWLASEFDQPTHSKEDNWQNFKSLCKEQKKKDDEQIINESDGSDNVKVPASRVCYVDLGKGYTVTGDKYEKGNLGLWGFKNAGTGYEGFDSSIWSHSNLLLWEYFRTKYPAESPLDKFDEWYEIQIKNDSSTKITDIKNVLG